MRHGGVGAAVNLLAATFFLAGYASTSFADQNTSREKIRYAYSLEQAGRHAEAIQVLESEQINNPKSRSLNKALGDIRMRAAKSIFHQGYKLYRRGEFNRAIIYFDEALAVKPDFTRAQKYKEQCLIRLNKASQAGIEKTAPYLIADGRGRRPHDAKTRVLFEEGRALVSQGKFKEAQEKFEGVLVLNPYHIPAKRYVDLLQQRNEVGESQRQAISEEERMIEVRREWLPPKQEKVIPEVEIPWKAPIPVSEARKRLEAQAQQVIPAINFNNAHLADVIKYLSKVSGINIIIDESVFEALFSEEIPLEQEPAQEGLGPEMTQEAAPPATPPAAERRKTDRVTIALKDVPLIEALKYILRAKGLRYIIEDYAIIIVAAEYVPPEDLETRYYHLSAGVGGFTSFTEPAEEALTPGGAPQEGAQVAETITIKDILEQSGVPWPEGSKIFLDQRTGTLIVRNTPSNLQIVEDILRTLDVAPYQVAITARFIELQNTDAEELGIEWLLRDDLKFFLHEGAKAALQPAAALQRLQFDRLTKTIGDRNFDQSLSGNQRFFTTDPLTGQVSTSLTGESNPILSFSGILTRPEFSIVLHAINQKTKTNVLSSPRVTTVNGQRAQIKLVQEFIYPTEYEVTPATTNSQGTVTTPPVVSPGSFETRDIGIVLDVTPNVGADRKTINLTIIPEVSEFVTWLDYGVPTQIFEDPNDPNLDRTLPGYPILQPLFQTRTVTTSVIVNDGDTVVLGGLIRDQIDAYNDKIPFLGDIPLLGGLFRKKGQISIKKNLVIFVTAELITPSGDPYAPTQFEPGETLVPSTAPEVTSAASEIPPGPMPN